MSLVTLNEVLHPALDGGYAVAGLVVLGWEDALAYVQAAEDANAAIILQAGPGCRTYTPIPILGRMFCTLAEQAQVPVVAHLDHGFTLKECQQAIECGFTSVMFDGSSLPLEENIARTAEVVAYAQSFGVPVEGEIGFVGANNGKASHMTDPYEAHQFAKETQVDALAVSIGNLHLQQQKEARINRQVLDKISTGVSIPLVVHGGSGINYAERQNLARTSPICKFNIGTELRQTFGDALRCAVNRDATRFDRIAILSETIAPLRAVARDIICNLGNKETNKLYP